MKKSISSLLVLFTLIISLFVSCASTSEKAAASLSKGNYHSAIAQALEALSDDSGDSDALFVLNDAWTKANSEWSANIDTFEKSSDPYVISKAFGEYEKLIDIQKMLNASGRSEFVTDVEALTKKLSATKNRVADIYFEKGSELINQGGRANAKDALSYFTNTKYLVSDYPNIEHYIEEANTKAIARVILFTPNPKNDSELEIISSVSEEIASQKFVELVATTAKYDFFSSEAKDFATSKNANIMVYFDFDINTETGLDTSIRPINSGVISAPDWEVTKYSLISSGLCNVNIKVLDLDTDSFIKEDNFDIKDSTDFGFSISSIGPATLQTKWLDVRDMKPQKLNVAIVRNDSNPFSLEYQLSKYEDVDLDLSATSDFMHDPMSSDLVDFNQYNTPKDLRYKPYNKHIAFSFDIMEMESVTDVYSKYYWSYTGIDDLYQSNDRIKSSKLDRENLKNLINWMSKSKTIQESTTLFLEDTLLPTVSDKIANNIATSLK